MVCSDSGEPFYVPPGEGAGIPDARTMALNAVKQVPFVTADLHTAPASEFFTYVHIENWLWIPAQQWRNLQASVAVGGTRVTVTAEVVRSEWAMDDGNTKTCWDPGRVSVPGMTDAAKTTCSYAYTELADPEGDKRTISAHLVYDVRWSCTGACTAPGGPLGEYPGPSSTSCLEVRQRQTVNTGPEYVSQPGGKNYSTLCS